MQIGITLAEFLDGPLADAPTILSDLDGCLIAAGQVLPGVARLFDRSATRLSVVSNNSADTAQDLTQRLAEMGLHLAADRVFLAGEATVRHLARSMPGARLAAFAAPALLSLAEDLGLRLDRHTPDLALLARDPGFCFDDLIVLTRLADAGLPIWITNPDPMHPAANGTPLPETGAIWAAVQAVVPSARAQSLGKPAPDLVRAALTQAGALPG
jgi:ribonucleotide monophosphatase NagD (HAD superfamily)